MKIVSRIVAYRPSVTDLIGYACLWFHGAVSGVVGTTMFHLKSLLFGFKLGRRIRCYGPVQIMRFPRSVIDIGSDVSIISSSRRCTSGSIYAPTKIRTCSRTASVLIDNNVGLNGTSITARSRAIRIGEGTMIAPNVTIMDSDFHEMWPPECRSSNPGAENDDDVIIGKNVWIGSRSTILKGVRIGDNSVIAAGSVVTSNIPPDVLAGGVPARIIRNMPMRSVV